MIQVGARIIVSADLVISELTSHAKPAWDLMKLLCNNIHVPFGFGLKKFLHSIAPIEYRKVVYILLVVPNRSREAMSITQIESPSYAMEELHRLGLPERHSRSITARRSPFPTSERRNDYRFPIACNRAIAVVATGVLETWTALSLIRGRRLSRRAGAVIATIYA